MLDFVDHWCLIFNPLFGTILSCLAALHMAGNRNPLQMEKLKIGPPEKSLQTAYIARFLEDSEVDVNGDGKFNFTEFMKMCRYELKSFLK